ncbi:MAG: pilus assembly protein TadG-related protein, partial [Gammaproteobacteria bacterium]
MALVAVGMLAIIGMAGLALQSGHLFVNKTHLQNALDAAALSAAKTLKAGASVGTAGAAGRNVFEEHVAPESGDSTFLEREMRDSSYTLAFEFSATLDPFNGGATEASTPPATFVRAKVTGLSMDTWLANVLPGIGDEQDIGGTAVAGP